MKSIISHPTKKIGHLFIKHGFNMGVQKFIDAVKLERNDIYTLVVEHFSKQFNDESLDFEIKKYFKDLYYMVRRTVFKKHFHKAPKEQHSRLRKEYNEGER